MLQQAKWIYPSQNLGDSCPVFRKQFSAKDLAQGTLTITALGVYEAWLNGKRVGDFILAPGWTNYLRRLQVQTYDVTELLEEENELLITVGNGWFKGHISLTTYDHVASGTRLLAEVKLTDKSGNNHIIATGTDWEAAGSNITFSDLYDGETYDARIVPTGWQACSTEDLSKDVLIPQEGEKVVEHESLAPVELIRTPKGEIVLDFGQEITGYVSFTIKARAGEEVILSHGEVLDADGNFYNANYRAAKSLLHYICQDGVQSYKPIHSFMGFRYVRVDRCPEGVDPMTFRGVVVHSEMRRTGHIETSNPMLNQLFRNIIWSQRDNFLDVPTDCPQRDERLGWTGDAQAFIRTAATNFDVKKFFTKWIRDLASEQRENGAIVFFIPSVNYGFVDVHGCSGSAWADAATVCPWQLYLTYGDKELLREHLPMMKKYVDYVRGRAGDNYLWENDFQYGDWLGLDAEEGSYTGSSRKELIATAFFAYSTGLLIKAMDVLGEDPSEYKALWENIVEAFHQAFPEMKTQTECALALHFGIAKDPAQVAATLARLVKEAGNHLATGFVGTPYLLHALSENGYTDVAYTLLLQEEYPSWLFSVRMGATTTWEHWDSRKEDGSFWSTEMNSFNHYCYGAVADWMYGVAAGIQTVAEAPAYEKIVLAPNPDQRLGFFKASVDTAYGVVRSGWKWNGDQVSYEFDVPNKARICLPGKEPMEVEAGHYEF